MTTEIKAVASIIDCESNCGINKDKGIFLKFAKNDTADIVTIALTNKYANISNKVSLVQGTKTSNNNCILLIPCTAATSSKFALKRFKELSNNEKRHSSLKLPRSGI